MVKKLPTIERSKTISIGEKIRDNQADRSVVINASDEYINTESNNVYISPIQTVSDTGTFLAYDHITKRLINSDIGVTELLTNIHSTTLQLTNGNTSLLTSGNVGISNTNPTDTLSIGDRIIFSNTRADYTMIVNQGGITIGDNISIHPDEYYALNVNGNAYVNDMTVSGNLVVQGDKFIVEANSFAVSDRIIGIANNNQTHTFDVGIIMEHPGKNLALIHHGENGTPHDHNFTIGYTQDNITDDFVSNDPLNPVTVEVLGNLLVQNNITISSGGSIYGDGTQLTGVALKTDLTSNASRVGVLETDLTSNASRVGVLETDLTSNASRVGVLETDLTSNASRVGVLETDLTSNASRVGVLETDLTSNASRVGVLETDLASNSTSITNLQNSTIISNSSGITNAFETGDLIYASSQNTLSNLSIGSTNEVLTVSGTGIPVWATASGGGGGGYWTQHINGNDIYYNSGNVGIANTAPTNTLSVGTVVSIQETASGDVLIVKGGGYFNDDVYIAKRLTVPVGGEIKADTIKVRSLSQKGTLVVAERLVDTISLG